MLEGNLREIKRVKLNIFIQNNKRKHVSLLKYLHAISVWKICLSRWALKCVSSSLYSYLVFNSEYTRKISRVKVCLICITCIFFACRCTKFPVLINIFPARRFTYTYFTDQMFEKISFTNFSSQRFR